MSNGNHRPGFAIMRLFRKKSEKGATYFTGRLGGARVALLKSNDTGDDGSEIWNLVISEVQQKRDSDSSQRQQEPAPAERRQPAAGTRDWQRPDDEIPFAPQVL